MIYKPHPYQKIAESFLKKNPFSALFLGMGLGKTSVTLSVIKYYTDSLNILRPLVIAPRMVTEATWIDEINKWEHLNGLTVSRIIGTEKERIIALNTPADIYAVSRDNIAWLEAYLGKRWNFDWVVIDESSSFKNPSSKRFKALKRIRGRCTRFTLLTGTPAPNGLMDLWAQIYLLDGGKRLGQTIEGFRTRYFHKIRVGDMYAIKYELKEGAKEKIYSLIEDICLSMKAEDWLSLEPRTDIVERIHLPEMEEYNKFKRDKFIELLTLTDDGVFISPANAAALYNKLLQFCNGTIYDDEGFRVSHSVSTAKLDALEENIEALNGNPVLIFYQFKSDIERIQSRFPDLVLLKSKNQVDDWNAGKIPILLAHGASAAHGLNMQDGGYHILWYGLPWSLEIYLQAIKRLDRQGQKEGVINKMLICAGTVEELVYLKLMQKDFNQNHLIDALRHEAELELMLK